MIDIFIFGMPVWLWVVLFIGLSLLWFDSQNVFGLGVGDNYVDEKTGKKLEDLVREAGLWV